MIKIVIKTTKQSSKICSIEVKGHAGSAPKGKDLVCAAISAIITGGFSSLNDKNFEMVLESGYAKAIAIAPVTDEDAVVLKTIETQLECVRQTNGDYVKIEKD